MAKSFFQFEEQVTYMHSIEVNIPPDQEDNFKDFCYTIAEKIDSGECDNAESIAAEFEKRFGEENVTFCEDGSPNTEFEAI